MPFDIEEKDKIRKTPIGEILTAKVITATRDTSLVQAAKVMAENRISCLVVAEDGVASGIITERDIVKHSLDEGDLGKMPVSEVMSSPVTSASDSINIFEAYHILATNKIRHVVINDDDGKMIGVVTQSDIINSLGLDLGEIRKISRIMTRKIITAKNGDTVADAIHLMDERSISCVIVEDANKPLGVISERDITKFLVGGSDSKSTKVDDIMSHPVVTIDGNMPIHEVARLMNVKRMRRFVVVDDEGATAGLVTQSDLIKGVLEGKYIEALKEIIRRKDAILKETEKTLIEKTIFLDSILHSAKDLAIVATDPDLNVVYYNSVAETMFGYSTKEVVGNNVKEIHKRAGGNFYNFDRALEQAREEGEYTFIVPLSGDGRRVAGLRLSPITDHRDRKNTLQGYMLMGRDISQRRRDEDILRESEEKYRSLFENSKDVVYISSLDGEIKEVNSAGAELFGYSKEKLMSMNIKSLYQDPETRHKFAGIINSQHYVKDYELELKNKNGEFIFALVTAATQKDVNGQVIGYQGIIRDVTERKKQEEVINFLAFHDALTGLPNRRTFSDRLATELTHAKRGSFKGAVMFLDIDLFKEVNDTYGHDIGDQLLQEFAKNIQSCLRDEDSVSRLGGDEFTVLLSRITDENDSTLVAQKVLDSFKKPVVVGGNHIKVSVSIGISIFPADGTDPEELVKKADDAMYKAKQAGRNNYKLFNDS